ncbi:MAG: hypothetical protein C4297_01680 [Gemmataceae bacterium]
MPEQERVSVEELRAYLEGDMSEEASARIERMVRESSHLRQVLRNLIASREEAGHSVASIWRRHRLSCPKRDQLAAWVLGALDEETSDYIRFHIQIVGCSYCEANWADLEEQRSQTAGQRAQRQRRLFDSSAGYLQGRASSDR